jgi:hypothetical protein
MPHKETLDDQGAGANIESAHDPEKLVLDLIGDGHRFSDKFMRQTEKHQ